MPAGEVPAAAQLKVALRSPGARDSSVPSRLTIHLDLGRNQQPQVQVHPAQLGSTTSLRTASGTRSRGRGAPGGGPAVRVSPAAAPGFPAAARSTGPDSPRTSRSLSQPPRARCAAAQGPGLCSRERRPRPLRAPRAGDASRGLRRPQRRPPRQPPPPTGLPPRARRGGGAQPAALAAAHPGEPPAWCSRGSVLGEPPLAGHPSSKVTVTLSWRSIFFLHPCGGLFQDPQQS